MAQDQQAMDQAFADSKLQEKVEEIITRDRRPRRLLGRQRHPVWRTHPLPIREETEVFAVQLATFDEEMNARNYGKAPCDGEEAFISQYKQRGISGEKIRYRVAVGPMLSHTLRRKSAYRTPDIWG